MKLERYNITKPPPLYYMTTYHYCLVDLMVKYLKWIRVLVNSFRNMICRMEALVFDTACRLKRLTTLPWVPCSNFSVTFTFSTRLSPILCVFNDIKANQIKYLTTFCACARGTKRIKMPIYRTHTHEQWTIYGGEKIGVETKMGEKTSNCTCMKLVESGTQSFFYFFFSSTHSFPFFIGIEIQHGNCFILHWFVYGNRV